MSEFWEIYPQLKPSVVAIASKLSSNSEFPEIIGTGFIAREDGVVFTNKHVVEAIFKLPRHKADAAAWPAYVLYFHLVPSKGMAVIKLEITGVVTPDLTERPAITYGPDVPDVGCITVKARELPTLPIAERFDLNEGERVFLSGFPMGTDTLRAPGWLPQLSPTLQSGIVSAILPFPCENPHAILIDAMIRGGSSGSPVFDPKTGQVAAIAYGSLTDMRRLVAEDGALLLRESTSLALAVPAAFLRDMYAKLDQIEQVSLRRLDEIPTLNEIFNSGEWKTRLPNTEDPGIKPVEPGDLT